MNNIKLHNSPLLSESYYEVDHESGLKVCVFKKDMCGIYAILSTKFGGEVSEYEIGGKTYNIPLGCAHFLEHKMFDNENRAGADDIFSALGAYDNAYTSSERTAYLFSCTDNFSECLTELIRFVFEPYFTDESINKEIGIISEEIRGCIDDPYDRCHMNLLSAMYVNSNVKNEICGTENSIKTINKDVLYTCCKHFYRPSNMVLTVCGNVDCDEVLDIISNTLKGEYEKDVPNVKVNSEPPHVNMPYIEKYMEVGKGIQSIGIKDTDIPKDPKERLRKVIGVNLLCKMLFAESGDFYLDMLEKNILTPNFDCGYSAGSNAAYILIWDECDDVQLLLEKIKEHINDAKKNGLDISAYEREKRAAYAAYVSDFDSTEDIAFSLLSYMGEGLDLFEYPSILESVDIEYINKLLFSMFDDSKFSVSVILPIEQKEE